MNHTGVTFGSFHSFAEWGLRLKKVEIGTPELKKILVDVPGGSGVLDLSRSLTGNMEYGPRPLTFYFDARNCNYYRWADLLSNIAGKIHGMRDRIILDIDSTYYYDGLIEVSSQKSNEVTAEVVITAECQPYKMEMYSSLEDWLWDPFDFENGIVREYGNLRVNGSLSFVIEGRRKPVVPKFTVVSDDGNGLKVRLNNGTTYTLADGTSRVINLNIVEGTNTLYFTGNGTVSIDYRGGIL